MTLEVINNLLKKYITSDGPNERDLDFIKSIIDIVLSTPLKVRSQNYRCYYSLEDSIQDVASFYGTLDDYCVQKLFSLMIDDSIEFFEVDDHKRNSYTATSTLRDDGRSEIFLPFNNTIEDSYTINHEVLHDTNASLKLTEARFLFTEAISILGEMLQEDFYRESGNPPKEYLKNGIDVLHAVLSKSISLHIQIALIRLFQKYGEITQGNLSELDILEGYRKRLNDYLKYYSKCEELPFDYDQRHVMGYIFASHMHSSGNGKDMLLELNPILNELEFEDVLDSIGVFFTSDGYDLESDSKKILLKSYRNEVGRHIWQK